jgi:hypothetical protein
VGPGATLPVPQSQLSKEQLRSMEDDLDKDKDCQEMSMEERGTDDTNDRITHSLAKVRESSDSCTDPLVRDIGVGLEVWQKQT